MKTITLGELRRELTELLARPDDTRIMFGAGDLSFMRTKERGPTQGPAIVQIEFSEVYAVTLDFGPPQPTS